MLKALRHDINGELLLYLDLVYREPRTNNMLNRICTKLVKTSQQGQSMAYGSDARVDEQLD